MQQSSEIRRPINGLSNSYGAEGYEEVLGSCPQCGDDLAAMGGEIRCGCCGWWDEDHPLGEKAARERQVREAAEAAIAPEVLVPADALTATLEASPASEKKVIQLVEPESPRGDKRKR